MGLSLVRFIFSKPHGNMKFWQGLIINTLLETLTSHGEASMNYELVYTQVSYPFCAQFQHKFARHQQP